MNDCGYCFFSQMIDGTLFCNTFQEDMEIKYMGGAICKDYVNTYRMKQILSNYHKFLHSHLDIENIEELFEEFLDENKELF